MEFKSGKDVSGGVGAICSFQMISSISVKIYTTPFGVIKNEDPWPSHIPSYFWNTWDILDSKL